MEANLFYQLSSVMALAAVISLLFRALKQPLIVGYIITGFLAGPSFLQITKAHDAFESLSQIGIVLLLFMIGLGLNAAVIKNTGKPVALTFAAIVSVVGSIGFVAGVALGFGARESLILAISLLFSSTIIVIKAITDQQEQSRLYSQIAVGILLVEDVAATLALLLVSASSGNSITLNTVLTMLSKGVILAAALAAAGMYIMPRFSKLFAESQELLYVLALAWGFGVASLFQVAGFSIEVGALFAGVSLAHLPYAQEMTNRLKPLRDFFVLLFFIELGGRLGLSNVGAAIVPALVFSAIVMIFKPLVTMSSLGRMGYTKQTSFKAAVHLSQISEFSIVLIVLADKTHVVGPKAITVMTLTALITIILSAYMMTADDRLYRRFQRRLSLFERTSTRKELKTLQRYPLVLIGYQNGGHAFVDTFRKMHKRYVVIDFSPDVIENLQRQNIVHAYGDATDTELLDEIGVHKSELVISNIPDVESNRLILMHINAHDQDTVFICHAVNYEEAQELYDHGADYVLLPHLIGTEHLNTFIRNNGSNKSAYERHRKHQLTQLNASMVDG